MGKKLTLKEMIRRDKIKRERQKDKKPKPKKEPKPPRVYTEEEKAHILVFRQDIEMYANEHGLELTNIPGWTETKIKWMATNDRRCCCRPKDRICPCPEGLIEVERLQSTCLCSIFKKVDK